MFDVKGVIEAVAELLDYDKISSRSVDPRWPLRQRQADLLARAAAMDQLEPAVAVLFAAIWEPTPDENAVRKFRQWFDQTSAKPLGQYPHIGESRSQQHLAPVIDYANDIRRETAEGEFILAHHLLASALMSLSVQQMLDDYGIDYRQARQVFYDFVLEEGEDAAAWQRVLRIASFNIDNLVSRDTWTVDDKLGYEIYADAITRSILDHRTRPPLTIGIQAPWGHGKTSLMRMIQRRLDPNAPDQEGRVHLTTARSAVHTTYQNLIAWAKEAPAADGPMLRKDVVPFPTVWFNPLYYRETSQIWAGLAHAILHQLVARLTPVDRERFWFRLQQSRINVEAIRSDFYKWVLARFVPAGIAWLAIIAIATSVSWVYGGASVLGAIAHYLGMRHKNATKFLDRPFERYITEPNYQTELGLLHLIDHDLDGALSLLIGNDPERSVSVFIDDLDRCDPQTVNQVILAINQFLSLPRRNVFFFLGMDMEMVAAALEQAQKETLRSVAGPAAYRRTYGWRFMEKFVQLPFVIPHLDEKTACEFAEAHLRGAGGPQAAAKEVVEKAIEEVKRSRDAESLAAVPIPDDVAPRQRLAVQLEKSRKATELMKDSGSEEMRRLAEMALEDLELNPRTIVRYFCLVRVLRNIQFAIGSATRQPDRDRLLVVRAAHLLMNWPQFVQWLRNNPRIFAGGTAWKTSVEAIEDLAKSAADHQTWSKGLGDLLQTSNDLPPHLIDVSLYDYLRKIATGPGLKAMHDARMF